MIELKNVTVYRSGHRQFENLSLKIQQNENYVIQGHNGSGKTLLLEVIAGLHHHQVTGEIKYDFITDADEDDRYTLLHENIHYIPAHALQTFLSGYHDLFYQQRYYSMGDTNVPKVWEIFGDAANDLKNFNFPPSLQIESLLDLELTRLSNGQLKKVLILRNLIKKIPKILLFDYPYEGLDKESKGDLNSFMDQLVNWFKIQIIIVDNNHQTPSCINRRLTLENFSIKKIETVIYENHEAAFESEIPNTISTHSAPPIVEMHQVTIQYGEKKIITNLNWAIRKGERWALTGKNGSGKTTLFSLIYADHPRAYSQSVYLFGKRRGTGESIWDIKKNINYLGPELIHFLHPKNVMLSARAYIINGNQFTINKIETLIDLFKAHHYIDLPVRNLSSGQLQMMMLIKFFSSEKELLLLDEPFQFLDQESKQRVHNYLNTYLHHDITLVLITHYEADLLAWTQLRKSL